MAIDYGKEWQKLRKSTGHCTVVKNNTGTTLDVIMDTQIRETIDGREKLMEEYVKAQIGTEIIGADGSYHTVKLEVFGESRGTVPVSKNAFNTWLRNRRKGVK